MELAEKAVMHSDAGVEVGMTLVATGGAAEELAPCARHPLTGHQAEPQPFGSTAGALLTGAMRIDFNADHACRIRLLFRRLVDFASELIGLFAIASPGCTPSSGLDRAQAFKEQHTAG